MGQKVKYVCLNGYIVRGPAFESKLKEMSGYERHISTRYEVDIQTQPGDTPREQPSSEDKIDSLVCL